MSLGIRVRVKAPEPRGRRLSGGLEGLVSEIVFDRLQDAADEIRGAWPVDTGRSQAAWTVLETGRLSFEVRNDARDRYGKYAGYVHYAGEHTPLAQTLVPRAIGRAMAEIRRDLLGVAATGTAAARPSLTAAIRNDLRRQILRSLVSRRLRAAIARRARAAQIAA